MSLCTNLELFETASNAPSVKSLTWHHTTLYFIKRCISLLQPQNALYTVHCTLYTANNKQIQCNEKR